MCFFINDEYYVYNETISFEKFIQHQFLDCFDVDDIVYEDDNFILKTTVSKAKKNLSSNLKLVTDKSQDYIKLVNKTLKLISSKNDNSIICLYPGELYSKSNIEDLLSIL